MIRKSAILILSLFIAIKASPLAANNLEPVQITQIKSWHDLKDACKTSSPDVHYYKFKTDNGSTAHLVVCDAKSKKLRLRPHVNTPGCPTSAAAAKVDAIAAVNGGYFNLSNGQSASYVVLDGKTVCDPHTNPALMNNEKLHPFMPAILNRTEVRFLVDKGGKHSIEIARHASPLPRDSQLLDSLQAGPQLLPDLTEREEAFVRTEPDGKDVDSIGAHKTAARTAFGITADGHAMLLCIAGSKQDEFSSGMTLADVADLLKRLGCEHAMNFDGGTSTTMVVSLIGEDGALIRKVVCGREPETTVKSALVLEAGK